NENGQRHGKSHRCLSGRRHYAPCFEVTAVMRRRSVIVWRMNAVLEEIFKTRRVARRDGSAVPLEFSISEAEGQAVQRIIRELKPRVTLEIGLAHGVSAVFICEALKDVGSARHIVIDSAPVEGWNDVGLYNIER